MPINYHLMAKAAKYDKYYNPTIQDVINLEFTSSEIDKLPFVASQSLLHIAKIRGGKFALPISLLYCAEDKNVSQHYCDEAKDYMKRK